MTTEKPKKTEPFYICKVDWIHVGTVAVFGVDEKKYPNLPDPTQTAVDVATKMHAISYSPGPVVVSKMGEDVPEPVFDGDYVDHVNYKHVKLTLTERQISDKFFYIIFLRGEDREGDECFAYVNVRGDRVNQLLDKVTAPTPVNLPDYATIVITGKGELDASSREKLQRDYLFGERHVNIRIFPPLDEVNNK